MRITVRDVPPRTVWALEQAGVHPLLARLFAARGITTADDLDDGFARLLPPSQLLGAEAAARLLADAIEQHRPIVVVADYDCDGATACAVALRGLARLGAAEHRLAYVVPDRRRHGYGLTPAIVDLAGEAAGPSALLVTVDNGIASLEGVAHAKARGFSVLVTDHHLPALHDGAVRLPAADVIVNPNQPGCGFASKSLAGVGVMFYVLLALRAELRARGRFEAQHQPRLDALLDLVALGTVADVVRLDANNRRLVAQGLKRIRSGRMHAGVAALFAAAGRETARASAFDFGFAVGPRLNAAGRMENMRLGIECLLTDDLQRARELASQLDGINRERREVETGMRDQAEAMLARLGGHEAAAPNAVALYDPAFHEGVVGIVAARVKDRLHRPTFVFARGRDGLLKGSGRSIAGFHLRDALDLVSKRHPDLLHRFGGHAMAAGATLAEADFARFAAAFEAVAGEWLDAATLARRLATDGALDAQWFDAATVHALDREVWGQAFDAPLFCDDFEVLSQRLVGDPAKGQHLKLGLRHAGPACAEQTRDAIWFGRQEPVPDRARLAFRLAVDAWQGRERVQVIVQALAE
ncbi:MAG TPA: single-stranded-DNA-specific exonuclease RecJ [Methylibium sp.]|uniref:single-stranded-DNA-specific exonuclease RecJ n=1 Tax=Methylibium sp. TaxID=2067992 RepID=UPI002DBAA792|nr:single-stranded-DNA-specific exonuclease RecJ [Methylibium sp.]HEU4458795.1 single-stranded-DNA-specific exonuclease RecJ [Methylibium sp.]